MKRMRDFFEVAVGVLILAFFTILLWGLVEVIQKVT